jgi:hypothetical protein
MKSFLLTNWYKLFIGSSCLMVSFGFMIFSVNNVIAKETVIKNYKMVPVNADGSVSVKLSDEQLNKIIPKNEDGSINIKLNKEQLNLLSPAAIQSVNIEQVRGKAAKFTDDSNGNTALIVGTCAYFCQ